MQAWCRHCGATEEHHRRDSVGRLWCMVGPYANRMCYGPSQSTMTTAQAVEYLRGRVYRKPLALAAAPTEVPETLSEADTLRLRALGVTW